MIHYKLQIETQEKWPTLYFHLNSWLVFFQAFFKVIAIEKTGFDGKSYLQRKVFYEAAYLSTVD